MVFIISYFLSFKKKYHLYYYTAKKFQGFDSHVLTPYFFFRVSSGISLDLDITWAVDHRSVFATYLYIKDVTVQSPSNSSTLLICFSVGSEVVVVFMTGTTPRRIMANDTAEGHFSVFSFCQDSTSGTRIIFAKPTMCLVGNGKNPHRWTVWIVWDDVLSMEGMIRVCPMVRLIVEGFGLKGKNCKVKTGLKIENGKKYICIVVKTIAVRNGIYNILPGVGF